MKGEKKGKGAERVKSIDVTDEEIIKYARWKKDPRVENFEAAAGVIENEIYSLTALGDLLMSCQNDLRDDTLSNLSILITGITERMESSFETLYDAFGDCTYRSEKSPGASVTG